MKSTSWWGGVGHEIHIMAGGVGFGGAGSQNLHHGGVEIGTTKLVSWGQKHARTACSLSVDIWLYGCFIYQL